MGMGALAYLDAAGNSLTDLLDAPRPNTNLRTADFSRNRISRAVKDLSAFQVLHSLVLDDNPLTEVAGMELLPCLESLSLRNCLLDGCEGLASAVQLKSLDLTGNKIPSLRPLCHLTRLERLVCAANQIHVRMGMQGTEGHVAPSRGSPDGRSLAPSLQDLVGVEALASLRLLDLSDNHLSHMELLKPLRGIGYLSDLRVSGNPLTAIQDARLHVLYLLPQVTALDGNPVTPQEKVDGANLHGTDLADLRSIRERFFPMGELDDLGGAPPSLSSKPLARRVSCIRALLGLPGAALLPLGATGLGSAGSCARRLVASSP